MIHYCIAQVDRGEPILVQEVECSKGDSLSDLQERIHAVEHTLLVKAIVKLTQAMVAAKSS